MKRPDRPTALQDLIRDRSPLRRLSEEAARRSHLFRQVSTCLPPQIAAHLLAASLLGGQLRLTVDAAAWASRLRLAAPELLETLARRHGLACERLVVSVRPPPPGPGDAR